MSLEFTASRLLVPSFGSSIYTWGGLIGVILAGLSAGYHVGGKVADKGPTLAKFCSVIFSAGLYIVFIPFISSMVVSHISAALMDEQRQYASLVAAFILLTLPTFLLGIVSPYAVKLATRTLYRLGNIAGNLYSAATIGSIVGTFLTIFILIPNFEISQILFGLGLALIISSILVGLAKKRIPIMLAGIVFLFLLLSGTFLAVNPVPYYSGDLIYRKETPYGHLDVVDSNRTRALFLDGIIHSMMNKDDPTELRVYTKYFPLGLLFVPTAKNVLFVGGGGFSGPKYFLENYRNVTVDVVEIDPVVVDVAQKFFDVDGKDPRLNIYIGDARTFLSQNDKIYDIIVLDAYSKNYIPFHLMTLEYFRLLHNKLSSTGAMISNNVGSLDEKEDTSDLFRATYKTISNVFSSVYVFPTASMDDTKVQNIMLIGVKISDSKYYDKLEIIEKMKMQFSDKKLVDYASHYYDSAKIETDDVPLLTDNFAPVEKLLNPLTNERYNSEVDNFGNSKVDIHSTQGISIGLVLPAIIVALWMLYLKKIWARNALN